MVAKVVHSRRSDNYGTPQLFYDVLNEQFAFELDAAADDLNHKCEHYFTQEQDGLGQSWFLFGSIYLNCPYSQTKHWVRKAWEEAQQGCTVVMLLAARTDTRYFHDYIYEKPNTHTWFIRGRLKFGGEKNSAPFPSMVVVFGDDGAGEKLQLARATWEARR